MAWINDDFSHTFHLQGDAHRSDHDWVFCAQIFAGLNYSVTPNIDIYGGARWIYLADPTLFGVEFPIDDDWLLELGVRAKF